MIDKVPRRDPFYIRQERGKQKQAKEIIDFVRVKNNDPYRKYRKKLWNTEWEFV